jgi:probable HAF family extracellular repeat protein
MKRRRFLEAVTAATLVATGLMLGTVDVQAQEGAFFGLGTGVGIQHASADGSRLVGWRNFPDGRSEAILWTDGSGTVLLGTLGGTHSFAEGISADGSTVVGDSDNADGIREGFLWTEVTGMVGLGSLGGGVNGI